MSYKYYNDCSKNTNLNTSLYNPPCVFKSSVRRWAHGLFDLQMKTFVKRKLEKMDANVEWNETEKEKEEIRVMSPMNIKPHSR